MNEINELAATIMAGLLASSDYTTSGDFFFRQAGKKGTRYKPEVVEDSVALARALIAATKDAAATPTPPANAS